MQIEYKNNKIAEICTNQLRGKRKEQYAMDLVHPYRFVFEKRGNEIQIANIMEIVDYH